MPRVWMPRISRRPPSSGTPITISRSKRPGRRSASSIASGRLVAAMTTRFWRGSSPSSRRQQLGDQPLLGLAGDLAALGRDRIDLVDEDDRGRGLGRLLEQFAKPLLALAISRAHDLGAGDVEEIGVALVGDGARQPGLAGARGAVEKHALGRIDAEPLEDFGIAQRQLDHLAQLVDGRAHAAEIVIGDVGAALLLGLGIFGAKLDLAIGVDMDDALGRGRDHDQADLLEREGGRGQHLAQFGRDVAARHLLLAGGGDDVAGGERLHAEAALQRMGRAVQAQILLRGREDDALGRASIRPCGPRRSRPSRSRHWRAGGRRGG